MDQYEITINNSGNARTLREVQDSILATHNADWLRFEIASPEKVDKLLAIPDLTEDENHAICILMTNVLTAIEDSGLFGDVRVMRGPKIVPAQANFADLRFEPENLGQSSTYTTWVDNENILRTHTSALVSSALSTLPSSEFVDTTIALPGIVFRRDVLDAKHLPFFHQLDIWPVKHISNGEYGMEDLIELVKVIFKTLLPNHEAIIRHTEHPYTLNGIEVSAKFGEEEIEIFEAGLAHPEVLQAAGLDPSQFSGLALGLGLDRLVMLVKNIRDIRLLRDSDTRVAKQMTNLLPYKEVSKQNPITRDLSLCVEGPISEEDLHELIRDAAGDRLNLIEKVEVLSVTSYDDLLSLNEKAVERLGMKPGQVNPFFRITFRHPSAPISKQEANALYQELYDRIHVNGAGYIIDKSFR